MTMMLHALELRFIHPISGEQLKITADLQGEFNRMIEVLGFDYDCSIKN